jgi:hypothetical protein
MRIYYEIIYRRKLIFLSLFTLQHQHCTRPPGCRHFLQVLVAAVSGHDHAKLLLVQPEEGQVTWRCGREDGSDMFLRNIGWLSTDYTALYPRRRNSLFCFLFRMTGLRKEFLSLETPGRTKFEPWKSRVGMPSVYTRILTCFKILICIVRKYTLSPYG